MRKRHNINSSNAGFTLIEVLVCVAILASVVMSMFAVYTHLTVEIRRSRNRSTAAKAAQLVLESIIAAPYDARVYHGLSSAEEPPSDSPVSAEVLAWKNILATFPVETAVQVTVQEEDVLFCADLEEESPVLCPTILQITVEIRYQDHGREAVQELSLTIEPG